MEEQEDWKEYGVCYLPTFYASNLPTHVRMQNLKVNIETCLTLARPKILCETKKIWHASQKFLRLYMAQRNRISLGLEFNRIFETQILQGCIISQPVEHTVANQKTASVGTVFANYTMAGNVQKILVPFQNLSDSDLDSHKNWVERKNCCIFFFYYYNVFWHP